MHVDSKVHDNEGLSISSSSVVGSLTKGQLSFLCYG